MQSKKWSTEGRRLEAGDIFEQLSQFLTVNSVIVIAVVPKLSGTTDPLQCLILWTPSPKEPQSLEPPPQMLVEVTFKVQMIETRCVLKFKELY
jgi:hypothetical protein